MSKKGFFPPYEYVYDEYFNCVICPENQVLSYATTNREGYREFKSKGYICENCPSRHLCTENQKFEKTVTKHIWSDYLETVEDIRNTPEYKALYERRKETIERVFADAKEKYAMRYTPYRGLSQVTNWVRLKFAAMNLKKYALHRWKRSHQYSALINLYTFFCQNKTHNPKSRLKFRVIRQTEIPILMNEDLWLGNRDSNPNKQSQRHIKVFYIFVLSYYITLYSFIYQ